MSVINRNPQSVDILFGDAARNEIRKIADNTKRYREASRSAMLAARAGNIYEATKCAALIKDFPLKQKTLRKVGQIWGSF